MTIAAESFTGRLLAVLSRRSPGFRPPLTPPDLPSAPSTPTTSVAVLVEAAQRHREAANSDRAPDDRTPSDLSVVTAGWKSISARERLRYRVVLQTAADSTKDAASTLDRDHRLALALLRDLEHARDIAVADVGPDLDLADRRLRKIAFDLAEGTTLAYSRILDHTRNFDRILMLSSFLAQDRTHILNGLLQTKARYFRDSRLGHSSLDRLINHNVLRARSRFNSPLFTLCQESIIALDRDIHRSVGTLVSLSDLLKDARNLALRGNHDEIPLRVLNERARDLAKSLDQGTEFVEAYSNLNSAASNFTGADLTGVDLGKVDLDGICWDDRTKWPSLQWKARMRRASVEHPPGSGIFIVGRGQSFADQGSLTPPL